MRDVVKIFYFSGTGNAKNTANWAQSFLLSKNIKTALVNIEHENLDSPLKSGDRIGFIFPVHGFTTIWIMLKFILSFPKTKSNVEAFFVTTLGALTIKNTLIPGWEGSGLYIPAMILRFKGYKIAGAYPLRQTPQNWTPLLPSNGICTTDKMMGLAKNNFETFLHNLFVENKKVFCGKISFIFGVLIFPLSFLYLVWGKFFLAKINYSTTSCNACGLCIKNCPVSAIVMKNDRPFWKFSCESCMRCMNYCPRNAIVANLPLFSCIAFFILLPLSKYLADNIMSNLIGSFFIQYALSFVLIASLYRLFFIFLGVKFFNRVFATIAPTTYFRKYRAKP